MKTARARRPHGRITRGKPYLYFMDIDQPGLNVTWHMIVTGLPWESRKGCAQRAYRWAQAQGAVCVRWLEQLGLQSPFRCAQVWVVRANGSTTFTTAALDQAGEWVHWRRIKVETEGAVVREMPEPLRVQLLLAWLASAQPSLL